MLKRYLFILAIWIVVLVFCALPALAEVIVDTAWVRTYNGPGNDYDEARAIAVDASGNIYVAGQSCTDDTLYFFEWATIKYDSSGNRLWVQTYDGLAPGSDDKAYAIAVDGSGNVYVTGNSWGGYETQNDYATIKYDSSGNQLWARRYNGPGNDEDYAYDIAVDASGNAYVTGFSSPNETTADCLTIKYNLDGNELWVRRYNGPANLDDGGNALALDSSGNVFVTGGSVGIGTHDDYLTIMYDSSGNELWV